jgi:hypothetical protein
VKLYRNDKEVCDIEDFKWAKARLTVWQQGIHAPAQSAKALSFFSKVRPQNDMGVNWTLQDDEMPFKIVIVNATPERNGYLVVARKD